jgi:galactokinase
MQQQLLLPAQTLNVRVISSHIGCMIPPRYGWLRHQAGSTSWGGLLTDLGSLVLQWPLDVVATAYVQRRSDHRVHVVSLATELQGQMTATFALADNPATRLSGSAPAYPTASADCWAAYMAGVVTVLYGEAGIAFAGGLTIVIDSACPIEQGGEFISSHRSRNHACIACTRRA